VGRKLIMEPITRRIKDMREQDKVFAEMEPSLFKRVYLMAADIRKRIDIEHAEDEIKIRERKNALINRR
jgi:hypothetical protein